MLYIVSGELIPESNQLYHGRMTAIGNIIGFFNRNVCNELKYLVLICDN